MTATAALLQDPHERYLRYREYRRVASCYMANLNKLMEACPMPGYKMDMKTGQFEQMPLDAEWQKAFDKATGFINEMLRLDFPEFFKEEK